MPRVIIEINLSYADLRRLNENSLERVLHNAGRVGAGVERAACSDSLKEQASTLWQDAEELTPLASRLWCAAQNAALEQLLE